MLTKLLKTKLPWIQAPMYHYSGPELAIACSKAGILGSLSVQIPERMKKSLEVIHQAKLDSYACNLFLIPPHLSENQPEIHPLVKEKLFSFRRELGLDLEPKHASDSYRQEFDEQCQLIEQYQVPIVIFTFGLPDKGLIAEWKRKGIVLIASATSVAEAVEAEEHGMDAVIVQGFEAGGHRTSSRLPQYGTVGLITLVELAKKQVSIPIIAAGGLVSGQQIRSVMALGAQGVSIGTLFLTASECNTPHSHRKLLHDASPETETVLTRLFTGRPARMIPNRFYHEMKEVVDRIPGGEASIPWNFYARDIFGKAARLERPDLFINWGGQAAGGLHGRSAMPAADIIGQLLQEYHR
jgi:nitronate monooxygenase